MPWWAWLLLALYIVAYALAFRRIAGQWAWHFAENGFDKNAARTPTGEHWFGAIAAAFFLSFVWPFALPVAYGIQTAKHGGSLFYTPPNARERLYKARIEQLEREAGIR